MPPVPKPEKRKKADERPALASEWLDRVARAGCVLCREEGQGNIPCGIHHPREGQGAGQRASDYLGIGLCHAHHQGANGYHGLGKNGFYMRYRLDEMDLLAMTIEGVLQQEAGGVSHG